MLQAIETEQVYPALGVLVKLARALGQRLGTFMDDQFREDPLIVRKDERKQEMAQHKGETPGPYRYFPLGRGKTDRHMEPFFIEIDPHQEQATSSHEGEEFIVVVSGEVELLYGKKTFQLHAGRFACTITRSCRTTSARSASRRRRFMPWCSCRFNG